MEPIYQWGWVRVKVPKQWGWVRVKMPKQRGLEGFRGKPTPACIFFLVIEIHMNM